MADNTVLNAGSGGDTCATDDIAGVKHQRVKVEFGADGSATDASPAAPFPVRQGDGASAGPVQVASSAATVTLIAANTARRGLVVFNDSIQVLRLKYGATASATSFTVKVPADCYWEMPLPAYTGLIAGIWAAANGFAYVTEIT